MDHGRESNEVTSFEQLHRREQHRQQHQRQQDMQAGGLDGFSCGVTRNGSSNISAKEGDRIRSISGAGMSSTTCSSNGQSSGNSSFSNSPPGNSSGACTGRFSPRRAPDVLPLPEVGNMQNDDFRSAAAVADSAAAEGGNRGTGTSFPPGHMLHRSDISGSGSRICGSQTAGAANNPPANTVGCPPPPPPRIIQPTSYMTHNCSNEYVPPPPPGTGHSFDVGVRAAAGAAAQQHVQSPEMNINSMAGLLPPLRERGGFKKGSRDGYPTFGSTGGVPSRIGNRNRHHFGAGMGGGTAARENRCYSPVQSRNSSLYGRNGGRGMMAAMKEHAPLHAASPLLLPPFAPPLGLPTPSFQLPSFDSAAAAAAAACMLNAAAAAANLNKSVKAAGGPSSLNEMPVASLQQQGTAGNAAIAPSLLPSTASGGGPGGRFSTDLLQQRGSSNNNMFFMENAGCPGAVGAGPYVAGAPNAATAMFLSQATGESFGKMLGMTSSLLQQPHQQQSPGGGGVASAAAGFPLLMLDRSDVAATNNKLCSAADGMNGAQLKQPPPQTLTEIMLQSGERTKLKKLVKEELRKEGYNCALLSSMIEKIKQKGGLDSVPGGETELLLLMRDEGREKIPLQVKKLLISLVESIAGRDKQKEKEEERKKAAADEVAASADEELNSKRDAAYHDSATAPAIKDGGNGVTGGDLGAKAEPGKEKSSDSVKEDEAVKTAVNSTMQRQKKQSERASTGRSRSRSSSEGAMCSSRSMSRSANSSSDRSSRSRSTRGRSSRSRSSGSRSSRSRSSRSNSWSTRGEPVRRSRGGCHSTTSSRFSRSTSVCKEAGEARERMTNATAPSSSKGFKEKNGIRSSGKQSSAKQQFGPTDSPVLVTFGRPRSFNNTAPQGVIPVLCDSRSGLQKTTNSITHKDKDHESVDHSSTCNGSRSITSTSGSRAHSRSMSRKTCSSSENSHCDSTSSKARRNSSGSSKHSRGINPERRQNTHERRSTRSSSEDSQSLRRSSSGSKRFSRGETDFSSTESRSQSRCSKSVSISSRSSKKTRRSSISSFRSGDRTRGACHHGMTQSDKRPAPSREMTVPSTTAGGWMEEKSASRRKAVAKKHRAKAAAAAAMQQQRDSAALAMANTAARAAAAAAAVEAQKAASAQAEAEGKERQTKRQKDLIIQVNKKKRKANDGRGHKHQEIPNLLSISSSKKSMHSDRSSSKVNPKFESENNRQVPRIPSSSRNSGTHAHRASQPNNTEGSNKSSTSNISVSRKNFPKNASDGRIHARQINDVDATGAAARLKEGRSDPRSTKGECKSKVTAALAAASSVNEAATRAAAALANGSGHNSAAGGGTFAAGSRRDKKKSSASVAPHLEAKRKTIEAKGRHESSSSSSSFSKNSSLRERSSNRQQQEEKEPGRRFKTYEKKELHEQHTENNSIVERREIRRGKNRHYRGSES